MMSPGLVHPILSSMCFITAGHTEDVQSQLVNGADVRQA